VSYKSIERLYSDEEVKAALHNLFILLLKEEGTSGHFAGDGTGYSLSVEEHYRSEPHKEGKRYLYSLRIIDIETSMYAGVGFSEISEMDAYNKAIKLMEKIGVEIDSIALDKYYSSRKVIEQFGRKVSVFVMPKKNISKIGIRWSNIFRKIAADPVAFLSRYFMRNLSESGFSSDKRRFGGLIRQRKEDRQETALLLDSAESKQLLRGNSLSQFSIALLHNLYAIRIKPN